MNARQAKISMETSKEVANDKTLKTKQEKDRRLREKKQNNTKKFMDERKTQMIKQNREKEKLKVVHDKQMEELAKDVDNLIQMYKLEEADYEMSSKTEFFAWKFPDIAPLFEQATWECQNAPSEVQHKD